MENSLGPKESLALFNTLSHEQQLAVMMARTRLNKIRACPQKWSLAAKSGVAAITLGEQPESTNVYAKHPHRSA